MDIEKVNMFLERFLGRTVLNAFYASHVKQMNLNDTDIVMDFGCGTGNSARHMEKYVKRLVCVDIDKEKLKKAENALGRYDNVLLIDKPLGDDFSMKIDKINVVFVLHDFSDIQLSEITRLFYRILDKAGKVYVCEPKKETHGIDPKQLKKHFVAAGFRMIHEKQYKNKFDMIFMT